MEVGACTPRSLPDEMLGRRFRDVPNEMCSCGGTE